MRLKLKEDPREWRRVTLLTALGLALVGSLLLWRRVLPVTGWWILLGFLALASGAAVLQPRWFRGFYRASSRVGFFLAQWLGWVLLLLLFVFILTPAGLVLRLLGKDLLRLKRPRNADTYWNEARQPSSLDRLF
jgi:hypothetical protein